VTGEEVYSRSCDKCQKPVTSNKIIWLKIGYYIQESYLLSKWSNSAILLLETGTFLLAWPIQNDSIDKTNIMFFIVIHHLRKCTIDDRHDLY